MFNSKTLYVSHPIFALAIFLSFPSFAVADVVTDWNLIAANLAIPTRAPAPTSVLDLATVHIAMYDAIQAYEGRFEPYGATVENPSGSPVAAAAAAAHDVLVAHFAAQQATLDTVLTNYLTGLGLANDAGCAPMMGVSLRTQRFSPAAPISANGVRPRRPFYQWHRLG
jgi:hypothetical protein